MGRNRLAMKDKKAYLIFNETLNTLAILYQETKKDKTAILQPLDKSAFKEEKFISRNLESLIKDHEWTLITEL